MPNILFLPFALLASQLTAAPLSSPTIDQGAIDKRTLSSLIDDTIKDVINNVVNSTNSLETAVLGWSGKVEDTAPILAGSNSLLKAIQTGTAKVSNADDLSLVGLLGILTPTISLNKAVAGVADALIEKKTQADAAGLTAVVLGQLQDQRKAAQSLVDTLLTKLPSLTESLGKILASPSLKSLAEAIDVYSGK
ncbi:hypothetical protein EG327_011391 [Venturia inaequalis]|uniref:Antigenic cell wall galactomannoprotein n=1 Tax=Venturia inaequalis TaxID=5025 RepID=A0A8H3UBS2_VENIN|nr:hypothetical protein EG327_011391 [Venturia inaequalis]